MPMHEVDNPYSPYLMQLHGMPLEYFLAHNVRRVGRHIGEVIEVEDPLMGNKISKGFLRDKVNVNVNCPLIRGFRVLRMNLPKTWI